MRRVNAIEYKAAGETILTAALDAYLSTPHSKAELGAIALAGITKQIKKCLHSHRADDVWACQLINNYCQHHIKVTLDECAINVYRAAGTAAIEFAETLNFLNSEERHDLPF